MSTKVGITHHPLPWQSLESFTASTTLSEKVWRVINNLLFVAGGLSLYAIASRTIRQAPPVLSYASYVILALTVKKIVATIIGYAAYPAAFSFVFAKWLAQYEQQQFNELHKQGYITQKITLHKSGTAYDATLIGHKDTIANRKWSVYALGNCMAMEKFVCEISCKNFSNGSNTLLINGPSVGRSKGFPTCYQMGAGYEAGLQLLEKEVKATHIAFQGLSLGGGMMSEAIQAHEFDLINVKYLGIFTCTFSYLSTTAAAIVGFFTTPFFYLCGAELDCVTGAEKLKTLEIEHLIIQHSSDKNQGTDGVIPDHTGLASALEQSPTRTFSLSPEIQHQTLPSDIAMQVIEKIKAFFASKPIFSETI